MPDPREEAVAPKLQALIGSYRWTDVGLKRAAAQLLAAADAVDPLRKEGALVQAAEALNEFITERDALRARLAEAEHDATSSASAVARLHELLADAVTRAETAEAACETSGAALVVMNDLLKEAEADRDRLRRSHDSLQDSSRAKIKRLLTERDALTEALEHAVRVLREGRTLRETVADALDAALAAVKGREDA